MTGRIGVAVTTRNRPAQLIETLARIRKHTPDAALVVVDDASDPPASDATYRFNVNAGIARAKNKCLELLVAAGCDELFLFDDDAYPIADDWWRPYVDSPEPHLMRIFEDLAGPRKLRDITVLYRDSRHVAYSGPRGVMLYVNRRILDVVGGMDPAYGLWGYEHGDWSNRIHSAGLTSWRFADVTGSAALVHSLDEHEAIDRSVDLRARRALVRPNARRYHEQRNSTTLYPYREPRDVVLTCLFTRAPDPQRRERMAADMALLGTLLASLAGRDVVVFHDELDTDDPRFVRVETATNPYHQRWLTYWQWLRDHPEVRFVWCVDGTDVELHRDPFTLEPRRLYVGSEQTTLGCEWMRKNHRAKLVAEFIETNADLQLLNAGLVGGDRATVMGFLHRLIRLHWDNAADRFHRKETETLGVGDMALLNYVARTHYADQLVYGPTVNTVFKRFEPDNGFSIWRHK